MQEFEVGNEKFVSLDAGEIFTQNVPAVVKAGKVSEFIDSVWVGLKGIAEPVNVTGDDACVIQAEEPSVLHLVDYPDTYNTLEYVQRRSKFMQKCMNFHIAKTVADRKFVIENNFPGLSITQISSNLQVSYGTIQKIMASNGS